jgi:hypothetical protein
MKLIGTYRIPVDVYLAFGTDPTLDGRKHPHFVDLLQSYERGFDNSRPLFIFGGTAVNTGSHAALKMLREQNRIGPDYQVSVIIKQL